MKTFVVLYVDLTENILDDRRHEEGGGDESRGQHHEGQGATDGITHGQGKLFATSITGYYKGQQHQQHHAISSMKQTRWGMIKNTKSLITSTIRTYLIDIGQSSTAVVGQDQEHKDHRKCSIKHPPAPESYSTH